MNQTEANGLLASIVSFMSLTDEKNFTMHAADGVHMSAVLAAARAVSEPTKLCGYFQLVETKKAIVKTDSEGWDLPQSSWTETYTPTGSLKDVDNKEYMRLIKAFFRSGSVAARPNPNAPTLATMKGPIPAGFKGYTNAIGTATYNEVKNMHVIVSSGTNWKLVTVYPVA